MTFKPNYCKGVVIVHGKSELILAAHIKSNLHIPIEIYSENRGKTSIQIDGLMNILNNSIFKNKKALKKQYYIEEENKELKNFFIMPIMDLDDTSEEKIEKYRNGKMFNNHWLKPYITPIWNCKNFDEVLFELGIIDKLPSKSEKGNLYRAIFPINSGETDIEQIMRLLNCFENSSNTNIDIFIKKCLSILRCE